jgi:hypothetical protein
VYVSVPFVSILRTYRFSKIRTPQEKAVPDKFKKIDTKRREKINGKNEIYPWYDAYNLRVSTFRKNMRISMVCNKFKGPSATFMSSFDNRSKTTAGSRVVAQRALFLGCSTTANPGQPSTTVMPFDPSLQVEKTALFRQMNYKVDTINYLLFSQ